MYRKTISDVLIGFSTTENGLKTAEVSSRSPKSQSVQIKDEKRQSFFKKFLIQIKELMVLVLLVAGFISIIIGVIENSSSEIIDGAIILGIVVMNAVFGVIQERKSEKAIENLKNLTQPETCVLRDGVVVKIRTSDLVHGDVVCLDAGSIVPADLRLIESANLKINESSLTGESDAVEKRADLVYLKEIPLGDRKNVAYNGSMVESGHGKGIVVSIGCETELGKIATSLKETKKELTPLQKSIQGVGKVLTYLVLLIASVTFVLECIANPNEILQAFLTAVAISVAAIPESMPAVITIIMSLGMAKLSKQKAIIKRMHAVETLGACDVICSDKTGTITQNKMKVERVFNFYGENKENLQILYRCMKLCNDAQNGKDGYVGASTEVAIMNYACNNSVAETNWKRIDEISFNSQRKMMTTLNDNGKEKVCFMKGAIDRILKRCTHYLGENEIVVLDNVAKKRILEENSSMCKDALRVMGFAYKPDAGNQISEEGFVFLGLCGLQDPPRKEIEKAVKKCRRAGMRPIMITGDYKETALAIAKKVGIAKDVSDVMSGEEIENLSDEEFLQVVEKKSVFARVSPAHKVKIVDALKRNGHITAMTGDGVNDAPSLKKADIGIGMGKTGTDVTKDVADILITDDNFATIIIAVEEGRKIYSNIQKTIKYLFSANMAEILSLFFLTIIFPGLTFMLPVQILFVNLITDTLPAIALGTEPVEKEIMLEKPRKKSESLFSRGMGISLFVLGFVQTALTMAAYLFGLFMHNEAIAITMGFYTLNLIQLFYMFTARTKESCFKSNPFKNKLFSIAFFVGIGMLILMATTGFGNLLKLEKLNLSCWFVVVFLSVSIIFIGEFYKWVERKISRKTH